MGGSHVRGCFWPRSQGACLWLAGFSTTLLLSSQMGQTAGRVIKMGNGKRSTPQPSGRFLQDREPSSLFRKQS